MLVAAKSNLARLMATENLMIEQRHVQTASFDTLNRVLTVPVLSGNISAELYDLFLGHEVGHALETPTEGWHDSVVVLKMNRSILNVCEDARIEKKIKRKFPGIRTSFSKGYKELMDMDFFGVKDTDLNTLNLIDRINLHTKGGAAQNIMFNSEENELLRECEMAESFEETVVVSLKIEEYMKAQKEQGSQIKLYIVDNKPAEGNGNGELIDIEVPDLEDNSTDTYTIPNKESKDQKGDRETGTEKSETNKTGVEGSSKTDGGIESETDKHFRLNEKKLRSTEKAKNHIYCNIPEIKLENVIVGYTKIIKDIESYNTLNFTEGFNPEVMLSNFTKFRNESNKVVSYLVKEFEMRKNAEQQSRAKISKTGELNLSKIHEYKFSDDIFARMTKVPNGKSHGLVMFIDWSGSMIDHINSTVKQLLNLVLFCKKVNIPFEVYAFSTELIEKQGLASEGKIGDLDVEPFCLLNILSHKMKSREFNKMASFLLDYGTGRKGSCSNMYPPREYSLSGTPLNEAVIAAFTLVPKFKDDNKLEIVNTIFLTDGEGSSLNGRIESHNNHRTQLMSISGLYNKRIFFRDTLTKAVVEVDGPNSYRFGSGPQTIALLKLLKQRIGGNLIGFYIAYPRALRKILETYSPEETQNDVLDKHQKDFRKNNFTFLSDVGYSEYYFLRSDKLDTEDEEEFQVNSNTTRSFVSAFTKYAGNRISNRIILNRFIKLIA